MCKIFCGCNQSPTAGCSGKKERENKSVFSDLADQNLVETAGTNTSCQNVQIIIDEHLKENMVGHDATNNEQVKYSFSTIKRVRKVGQ